MRIEENLVVNNNSTINVFLSRNYRLIVALQKCDVLKTNICPRSESGQIRFKNITFPRGNYQTDSSET